MTPVALLVAAPTAGCGEPDPVRVNGHRLTLVLDEYRIRPEVVSVPAGRLTIVVRDRGILTHNVRVQRESEDPEAPPVDLGGTSTAHPGRRAEGTVDLLPGEYRMVCTIANHDELGQYGTLIVRR